MIKFGANTVAKETGKPGRLLGLGLSFENLIRLRAGQPISFNLGEVFPDLADVEVLVVGGMTEADIRGQLAPLLGPETAEPSC